MVSHVLRFGHRTSLLLNSTDSGVVVKLVLVLGDPRAAFPEELPFTDVASGLDDWLLVHRDHYSQVVFEARDQLQCLRGCRQWRPLRPLSNPASFGMTTTASRRIRSRGRRQDFVEPHESQETAILLRKRRSCRRGANSDSQNRRDQSRLVACRCTQYRF